MSSEEGDGGDQKGVRTLNAAVCAAGIGGGLSLPALGHRCAVFAGVVAVVAVVEEAWREAAPKARDETRNETRNRTRNRTRLGHAVGVWAVGRGRWAAGG